MRVLEGDVEYWERPQGKRTFLFKTKIHLISISFSFLTEVVKRYLTLQSNCKKEKKSSKKNVKEYNKIKQFNLLKSKNIMMSQNQTNPNYLAVEIYITIISIVIDIKYRISGVKSHHPI